MTPEPAISPRNESQHGDSRHDTLRVLKRYIARETFALIRDALRDEQPIPNAA
jgi:hypothetical protein